jgi:hypothetical protein
VKETIMATASQQPPVTLTVPQGTDTIHDTLESGQYHLLLGLSPEVNRVIEDLALHYRGDKADVINIAISLLKRLSDAVKEGKRVGIAAPDQELETVITGL